MMLLIGEMGVDSYIYAFSNNVFPRDSIFFYLTSLYLYCKKKKKRVTKANRPTLLKNSKGLNNALRKYLTKNLSK